MTATIVSDPRRPENHPARPPLRPRGAASRLWHGGRVEATAIYNALVNDLSRSARRFSSRACARSAMARQPRLAEEIKAFTTQEAIHSREHDAFNKRARSKPATTCRSSRRRSKRGWRSRVRGRRSSSLAATMALEHFTAILAHQLLANPRHLAWRRPRSGRLCGAGTRPRRSSIRASPTTPGFMRRAIWPVATLEGQGAR